VSRYLDGPVTVRVPATSANLGPGFDSLGLALTLHDVLTASVDRGLTVEVEGEGADDVLRDEGHLVVRAAREGFLALGEEQPGLRLRCVNLIPHGRGLGSSSAAIVGGLALARGLVVDGASRMSDTALLALAARIEGHPDNVAPAVLGGLTVAWSSGGGSSGGGSSAVRLEVGLPLAAVAFVPPDPLSTEVARGLLPASVLHPDAAANAGRASLLVATLTGQVAVPAGDTERLLLEATEDRLHQQYRAPAMPDSAAVLERLRSAGVAAFVSGAGPTVLALVPAAGSRTVDEVVSRAAAPDGWRALPLEVDRSGATVLA
jgi:homoserine kinase